MMRALSLIPLAGLLLACAPEPGVNRAQTTDLPTMLPAPGAQLEVIVPAALSVSDRNGFYPQADIVWQGEPAGDRHLQVAAILTEAAAAALPRRAEGLTLITVDRFHGVTAQARAATDGVYSIRFILRHVDPATGADLSPPRIVALDLDGPTDTDLARTDERTWLVDALTRALGPELSA
jgi:hypothetical protein